MPYVSDANLNDEEESQSPGQQAQAPGQVSGQPNVVSGATNNQTSLQNANSATAAPVAPTLASGTGAPQGTSPGSGMKGGSGGSGPSTYSAATPTSSGQWTNLQNYLNTNNGGQFGTQFAGNVGTDVDKANTDISNASNDFQAQVDQGVVQNNQDAVNEVGTAPQSMSNADQAAFEQQLNGSYSGPSGVSSNAAFQGAEGEAQNASLEGTEAGTPAGQEALLQKFYNTPTYSAGEQNLDSAILSSDPNAQAAIQQISSRAANLPVAYQSAANAAGNEVSQGQAESAANQELAQSALYGAGGSYAAPTGGAIGNLQNTLNTQATNDAATYAQEQSDIAAAMQSGDLTDLNPAEQAIVNGLGISNTDTYSNNGYILGGTNPVAATYGVSESPYLIAGPAGSISESSEATADQLAQANALAQLAGQSQNFIDPSLVGTAPTSPDTFNEAGYQNAINTAQSQYQNALSAILAQSPISPGALNGGTSGGQLETAGTLAQINALNEQYGLPDEKPDEGSAPALPHTR